MKNNKTYETQKEEILKAIDRKFGSDYSKNMEELSKVYCKEEENPKYQVTVNYTGAFCANEG